MAELQVYLDKILETYATRPLGSASVEARQYDMHQVLREAAKTVDRLCDVLRFKRQQAAAIAPDDDEERERQLQLEIEIPDPM
jgi:hypothetical protein